MKKKIIFRPELVLEIGMSAGQSRSKIAVKTSKDVIPVLEGIKNVTKNHLIIIYLDKKNVITEVNTFFRAIKDTETQSLNDINRSILNATQQGKEAKKVIVIQTIPKVKKPTSKEIDINNLVDLAIRISMVEVEMFDCMLMGEEGYFSFKDDLEAWTVFNQKMKLKTDFFN